VEIYVARARVRESTYVLDLLTDLSNLVEEQKRRVISSRNRLGGKA
jgi:hypothetical protein